MSLTASALPHVGVVGLGYIGLPTAAIIAASGLDVLGLEVDGAVVDTINKGAVHIEEKGLADVVAQAVSSGRLRATTQCEPRDVWLIAVPTPFNDDKTPDVSIVLKAAETLAPHLRGGDLVILESTSPVGTTERFRDTVAGLRPELFAEPDGGPMFAYCPERVLPGKILEELISNDRSIGGLEPRAASAAKAFYERFVRGACIETDARTAELVKLVENASRDVNIAFANELSLIAERLGVDVWQVIALANRHPRVSILQPGPGVGGHCIAVDPWFIVASAPEEARLIRTAREVNDAKPAFVIERAARLLENNPGQRMACLGLTFKPDTDDMRESPALAIVRELAARFGNRLTCVDPYVKILPDDLVAHGVRLGQWEEAADACGLGLVLVDHAAFRAHGRTSPFAGWYDTRGVWDQ